MLLNEIQSAEAALPHGFGLVKTGNVAPGDKLWDFVRSQWRDVRIPLPMQRGQKRPGNGQLTEIGGPVSKYLAVARKQ